MKLKEGQTDLLHIQIDNTFFNYEKLFLWKRLYPKVKMKYKDILDY